MYYSAVKSLPLSFPCVLVFFSWFLQDQISEIWNMSVSLMNIYYLVNIELVHFDGKEFEKPIVYWSIYLSLYKSNNPINHDRKLKKPLSQKSGLRCIQTWFVESCFCYYVYARNWLINKANCIHVVNMNENVVMYSMYYIVRIIFITFVI